MTDLVTDLDPDIDPSYLWQWIRDAAGSSLRNPLIRVRSRMINNIQERDTERQNLAAYAQVAPIPQTLRPNLSPQNPWQNPRLAALWPQLSPEEQEAARLVWIEEYTHEEAAEMLGIHVRTIRKRLTRILKKAGP